MNARYPLSLTALLWAAFAGAQAGETFTGYTQPFQQQQQPPSAPQVPFITADGQSRTLSDYRGQVVIVNFWASWCATCLMEMASLQRLQEQLADEGVRVLTLNQDLNDPDQIARVLTAQGADTLPAHRDGNRLLGAAMGQAFLPTTVIIDRQGRVAGQLIGAADWDSPEALQLVRRF